MMRRRQPECDHPLEGTTWAYPNSGFWITHAMGILGIGYMGYLVGKNIRG
ncbi:hypothetical protein V6C27_03470 [Peptococcaceae bacterium 1198_IL3148]